MELKWNDSPDDSAVFFSRDAYDRFSLAPSIEELWTIVQSKRQLNSVGQSNKAPRNEKIVHSAPIKPRSSEDTSWVDCDHGSDEHIDGATVKDRSLQKGSGDGQNIIASKKDDFPEPRLPYPRSSSIKCADLIKYQQCLLKKTIPPKYLLQKVSQEVSEFMGYLQNVSKACVDDYNYISEGASRYCADFLKIYVDHLKIYPQLYLLQETTSLLGNIYIPNLSLNLEKELLSMGNVDVWPRYCINKNAKLSVDYDCVSKSNPPSKKASDANKPISSDKAVERLSSKYAPDVCITKDALQQLLDQNSELSDNWELPMVVKLNPQTGKKTVYIESPLLKKELTVRDRNLLFYQESIKLELKNLTSKSVFFLQTGNKVCVPSSDSPEKQQVPRRKPAQTETAELDFEVDFTELESFGESSLSSKLKKTTSQMSTPKSWLADKPKVTPEPPPPPPPTPCTPKPASTLELVAPIGELAPKDTPECLEDDGDSAWTDIEGDEEESMDTSDGPELLENQEVLVSPGKRSRSDSQCSADSDESRLYIADAVASPQPGSRSAATQPRSVRTPATSHIPTTLKAPQPASTSIPSPASTTSTSTVTSKIPPCPATTTTAKEEVQSGVAAGKKPRLEGKCDQLGQILRMQTAMLKSNPGQSATKPQRSAAGNSGSAEPAASGYSLVKPSVTSFLEDKERVDGESGPMLTMHLSSKQKNLLQEDLLQSLEDETDFEAPLEGNAIYKLYSLHETLVMVRTSIPLAYTVKNSRVVPVCLLPKLEYQLSYGAECVTSSEASRLWTDTLLHPSTVLYIARINAHTSELVELQQLPSDWMQTISCDFHPARSLNILNHVLKKVLSLSEGQYLLSHRSRMPHFSILRACDKVAAGRSAYDLYASYSQPPVPSTPTTVPWVPVDPNHLLSFHKANKRPPCTFPPEQKHGPKQVPRGPKPPQQNATQERKRQKRAAARKRRQMRKKEAAAAQQPKEEQATISSPD